MSLDLCSANITNRNIKMHPANRPNRTSEVARCMIIILLLTNRTSTEFCTSTVLTYGLHLFQWNRRVLRGVVAAHRRWCLHRTTASSLMYVLWPQVFACGQSENESLNQNNSTSRALFFLSNANERATADLAQTSNNLQLQAAEAVLAVSQPIYTCVWPLQFRLLFSNGRSQKCAINGIYSLHC